LAIFHSKKKPPLHILHLFFTNLHRENSPFARIRVDEDGDLFGTMAFCKYIRDGEALNLYTTGGYTAYLNVNIECPNRTIAERVFGLLMNSVFPKNKLCYTAEHYAELY
jgi:hypothetical protein